MFPDRKARRNSFQSCDKGRGSPIPRVSKQTLGSNWPTLSAFCSSAKIIRIQSSVDSTPEVELSDAFSDRGCSELNFREPIRTYNCFLTPIALGCLHGHSGK
jgi:hypothetical protein